MTKLTFTDYTNNTTKEENIYYDAIGNPYSYRGAIMGWYGRQMITYSKNGVESSFTYDADGLRSSKTVAGVKTEYQYVGDKLFYEKRGDGNSFYYFYDSYGKLSAIYHHVNGNKTAYHVVTNAQGDVVALYSWTGTKVAEYSYDAWGNCTIVSDTSGTGIASLNPFRYRSYYRDTDLGLYYLQSRYYDSEIGRFINADGFVTTGQGVMSYNMYAYCLNNPVNMSDPTGNFGISAFLGIVVVIACVVGLGGCSKSSKNAPATNNGSAKPYTPVDSEDINCYGYATNSDNWEYVGGYKNATTAGTSLDEAAEMVLSDLQKKGISARPIDSYNSDISNNEYRIAMRINESNGEYHFMKQHNDGSWSQKHGWLPSQPVKGYNPSAISWDCPAFTYNKNGDLVEAGVTKDYYSGKTRYIAITN